MIAQDRRAAVYQPPLLIQLILLIPLHSQILSLKSCSSSLLGCSLISTIISLSSSVFGFPVENDAKGLGDHFIRFMALFPYFPRRG